jgi:glycosyltransferase involved in cell wall biosynthesis
MRILLVSYYNPLGKGGFEKQTFGMIEILVTQGHELSCLTIASPENCDKVKSELELSKVFKLGCFVISHEEQKISSKAKTLFWLNRKPSKFLALQTPELLQKYQEKIHELSTTLSIDVIHCLGLRTAYFLPDRLEKPTILDLIDSMTLRKTRELKKRLSSSMNFKHILFASIDLLKTFKIERDILNTYPQSPVTTLSPIDRATLKWIKHDAYIKVMPSSTFIEPKLIKKETRLDEDSRPVLVFYGYLIEHNYDALCFLTEEIMPIVAKEYPQVKLLITGFNLQNNIFDLEKKYPWVKVYKSTEDINSFISLATLVCFPFRIGCGVKTKILECMALGKPIVTTTIGAEALLENQKQGFLIADDADGLAKNIINLFNNADERIRLGEINYQIAVRDFTWEKKAEEFLNIYKIATDSVV